MVPGESSVSIRARVEAARVRQNRRFAGTNLTCSADMGPAEIREYCIPLAEGQSLICSAMRQMHLSARGYHRALKVSRTIADPEHVDVIRRIIWQRRCSTGRGCWIRRGVSERLRCSRKVHQGLVTLAC